MVDTKAQTLIKNFLDCSLRLTVLSNHILSNHTTLTLSRNGAPFESVLHKEDEDFSGGKFEMDFNQLICSTEPI